MVEMLYSPFQIRNMRLKNRLIMSAVGTGFGSRRGEVTDSLIAYYRERALGGVGCVTTENVFVHPSGKAHPNMLGLWHDDSLPGFQKLVEAVHKGGARISVQLNHAGRQTLSSITGQKPVAPSPIPCPLLKESPIALNHDAIEEIILSFVRAAARAREAGADAVEFQMAHGYLICQFLSPYSNQREDEYGGSLYNRARFALEILRRTRKTVGDDLSLLCKVSADEMVEGGLHLDESKQVASLLADAGADAIVVSACNYASYAFNIPCYYMEEACFIPLAREIKSAVSLPVIGVGRIRSLDMAEMLVREKVVDLVAMGRALIADPQLPKRGMSNRQKEIRPCLSCNRCFESLSSGRMQLSCTVNPFVGQEKEWSPPGPRRKKTVLAIGGGVAGMEASRMSAVLGHHVTLCERRNVLGGQLIHLASTPCKAHFRTLIDYYLQQLRPLNVDIRLGVECDDKFLMEAEPDTVILATGAKPLWPDFIRLDDPRIIDFSKAWELQAEIRGNLAVVGGGPEGAEVADFFSSRGEKVTLIEMRPKIGLSLPTAVRFHLERRLKAQGVIFQTLSELLAIEGMSVKIKHRRKEIKELSGFDFIIVALGRRPNNELVDVIAALQIPYTVIGDAKEPRRIQHAIREGTVAGWQV